MTIRGFELCLHHLGILSATLFNSAWPFFRYKQNVYERNPGTDTPIDALAPDPWSRSVSLHIWLRAMDMKISVALWVHMSRKSTLLSILGYCYIHGKLSSTA